MVRPRLVEEGKPIAAGNSDDSDQNILEGSERSTDKVRHHHSHRKSHPKKHAPDDGSPQMTSLMQAAKGKLPKPSHNSPSASRYVIGGEDHVMEAEPMDKAHAHTSDPQHQHFSPTSPALGLQPHASSFQIPYQSQQPPLAHAHEHAKNHLKTTAQHYHHQHPYAAATTTTTAQHHLYRSHQTHYEIGADYRPTERMEGIEDHSQKTPLVVVDGANIAYAYAQTLRGVDSNRVPVEPDARGIRVACKYFADAGLRARVVLPASWFRRKPRAGDPNNANALMETDQLQVLHDLQQTGLLVAAPPMDDDDAYALTIAQRENARAAQRNGQGPGYVLSNDLFRDAQARDATGQLEQWLNTGYGELGPGRISYTFCDMGVIDDYGDRQLDIVPNPRHPLVAWAEQQLHQQPR